MKDLFWRDTGSGRPLVFLHGGFLDHRMWDDQIPVFAADHRVIAPDARGHGRSANASGPFRHGDDVADLLRRLDAGPAILVGLSMGGGVAVDVALDHPELVAAVIVSGAGTIESSFTDPWTAATVEAIGTAIGAGDADAAIEAFMAFAAGPARTLGDVDHEVVRRLYEMVRGSFAKHTADEPRWMLPSTDTWARAAGIRVPVHAINGALDSPDHLGMAERLVDTVGTGRVVTVGGTAHYPNMERPDQFDAALRELLRTL
ncbi:alpha/beta hydrolase [Glycomyces sp. TRM65418]|uniref:alpha/beta fold hydrolase n=1 Tax=Glycomyces sp. TRM65418 TaxID=2867006 RepID=UPI001CE60418|nr:alpha/beta hydrolase [Glycomyces sp. TRM65418]MCC3763454.1 alpha/beta hydrolase [Glycomyces sp. TRM65418]QZD57443.1 alpha/beta hydrolase [Glycomyces sp. TRM65418]